MRRDYVQLGTALLCLSIMSTYMNGTRLPDNKCPLDIEALLDAHDGYLRRRGRAPGTRQKYGHNLEQFGGWLAGGAVTDMTTADIDRFLAGWEAGFERRIGREPSRSSVRLMIAALRSFYGYLDRSGLLVDRDGRPVRNPMLGVIAPELEPHAIDFLDADEDAALLAAECDPSERVAVWLLRWTGARVGEACNLRLEDIDLRSGRETITITVSKSRAGRRAIPVVPELIPELEAGIQRVKSLGFDAACAPILATRTGNPMTASYVWRLVKRVGARAGVRPIACTCDGQPRARHEPGCPRSTNGHNLSSISPHTLRRTFGSDLINRGLRLEVVSRLLGHSSTAVTEQAYAHLLDGTIRRELLEVVSLPR
jgi:integrase